METPNVTVQMFIDILNEALALDKNAISELIENRVSCNEGLAEHPTIQVSEFESGDGFKTWTENTIGMLGIINGICEKITGKRVAYDFDDNTGEIKKFIQYNG